MRTNLNRHAAAEGPFQASFWPVGHSVETAWLRQERQKSPRGTTARPTSGSRRAAVCAPTCEAPPSKMVVAADSQILPGQFFISIEVYIRTGLEFGRRRPIPCSGRRGRRFDEAAACRAKPTSPTAQSTGLEWADSSSVQRFGQQGRRVDAKSEGLRYRARWRSSRGGEFTDIRREALRRLSRFPLSSRRSGR